MKLFAWRFEEKAENRWEISSAMIIYLLVSVSVVSRDEKRFLKGKQLFFHTICSGEGEGGFVSNILMMQFYL